MFHETSTKLAGFYLAILMVISLFFSANIYQLSVSEFDRGIRGPGRALEQQAEEELPMRFRQKLRQGQEALFIEAKQRVIARLIFVNLIILVGGGLLSYYLAVKTLQPIKEAHESLERFTADASHELRTPIAVMRSENEVALMDPKLTLAQAKKQMESNIEELEKLTALSEGLLQLASQDSLSISLVSIQQIVNIAIDSVNSFAKSRKVIVKSEISKSLKVNADKSSLAQALAILLNNAVKYSPQESEVMVSAQKQQKTIVIEVSDQGPGIKSSDLPHIFDRFYRAETSRTKQQTDGYGLGLAIAKDIVERHGGKITVSSKLGKGSSFKITLAS